MLSGVFGAKHPAYTEERDASEDLSMTRFFARFVKHRLPEMNHAPFFFASLRLCVRFFHPRLEAQQRADFARVFQVGIVPDHFYVSALVQAEGKGGVDDVVNGR